MSKVTSRPGPLREPPGESERTGWRRTRTDGATTHYRRPRVTSGKGLLLLFPAVMVVTCLGSMAGLRLVVPILVLIPIVVMQWPLAEERLRVGPKKVVFKDRLLGPRLSCRLGVARLVKTRMESESAVLLTDGRAHHLLATGTSHDVDALVTDLDEALARARQARAR